MTIQYSVAVRNAKLTQLQSGGLGTYHLIICTGAKPANCAATRTGTKLADMALPSVPFSAPSGGVMSKTGAWSDTSADATGTAGYFYIQNGTAPTDEVRFQGTVGVSGSGADMILDSVSFVAGQTFTVLSFTLTEGNA